MSLVKIVKYSEIFLVENFLTVCYNSFLQGNGTLAQLGERLIHVQKVTGSSPARSTYAGNF